MIDRKNFGRVRNILDIVVNWIVKKCMLVWFFFEGICSYGWGIFFFK